MPTPMITRLREWYIVVIAVFAMVAWLYLASGPSMPSKSATQETAAPSTQVPQSKIASQSAAPVAAQTPSAAVTELVRASQWTGPYRPGLPLLIMN